MGKKSKQQETLTFIAYLLPIIVLLMGAGALVMSGIFWLLGESRLSEEFMQELFTASWKLGLAGVALGLVAVGLTETYEFFKKKWRLKQWSKRLDYLDLSRKYSSTWTKPLDFNNKNYVLKYCEWMTCEQLGRDMLSTEKVIVHKITKLNSSRIRAVFSYRREEGSAGRSGYHSIHIVEFYEQPDEGLGSEAVFSYGPRELSGMDNPVQFVLDVDTRLLSVDDEIHDSHNPCEVPSSSDSVVAARRIGNHSRQPESE